jgi:hypothetical protein
MSDFRQYFSGQPETLKKEFHEVAKIWHPDTSKHPDAVAVFMKINAFYKNLEDEMKRGIWVCNRVLFIQDKLTNIINKYDFHSCDGFELGRFYIGNTHVVYVCESNELTENAIKNFGLFKFSSDRMKGEISRHLPTLDCVVTFKDSKKTVIVIKKTEDQLLLRDVMRFVTYNKHPLAEKGLINSVCIPWILSSLYNLACYMSWAKITHNDISPDTCFISTHHHSISILGGWWYSVPLDSEIKYVPKRTFHLMPHKVKINKKSLAWTDLECIRAIGRELLGATVDPKLKPLWDWLNLPSTGVALDDYEQWRKIVDQCYGIRKFIKIELDQKDLYSGALITSKKGS